MPYALRGKCVINSETGATVKCHPKRELAERHLRALYVNVPEAKHGAWVPRREGVWLAYSPDQPRTEGGQFDFSDGQEVDAKETAHEIRAIAERREPEISAALQNIAERTDGELEGFDFRIKEEDSIERKIEDRVAEGMTEEEASSSIEDELRYTVAYDTENYTDSYIEATSMLQAAGFERTEDKNYWAVSGDDYQGINTNWSPPDGGETIEIQFHTPESFAAKEESWTLYKEARLDSTPTEKRAALESQMIDLWLAVPVPPEVRDVGTPTGTGVSRPPEEYQFAEGIGTLGSARLGSWLPRSGR